MPSRPFLALLLTTVAMPFGLHAQTVPSHIVLDPVVLRAAKNGFKRCRELTWEQNEDYLYAKLDQAQLRDPEHGRAQGLKQFLDDKSIKPGLQAYKR